MQGQWVPNLLLKSCSWGWAGEWSQVAVCSRQVIEMTASIEEPPERSVESGLESPMSGSVLIVDYDPRWPEVFVRERDRVRSALGTRALRIEHAGSTAVPGLAAKPVIDVVLEVANSAREAEYAPDLEANGYALTIREPKWYEHRMFKGLDPAVNLHVFSSGCEEIGRMLLFRDWLRGNDADRDLYARTKLALAQKKWECVQDYADAKSEVVNEIVTRAEAREQQ